MPEIDIFNYLKSKNFDFDELKNKNLNYYYSRENRLSKKSRSFLDNNKNVKKIYMLTGRNKFVFWFIVIYGLINLGVLFGNNKIKYNLNNKIIDLVDKIKIHAIKIDTNYRKGYKIIIYNKSNFDKIIDLKIINNDFQTNFDKIFIQANDYEYIFIKSDDNLEVDNFRFIIN